MPIPKVIHYCWFGKKEKSELIKKCMESWKRFLPDYKIIEWNEDNFDVNVCKYVREAYQKKKWAFVSDYVRLYALYNHGGIYFDTDVEILRPLDIFLQHDFFTGFESKDSPITAVIAAAKGNNLIKEFLAGYSKRTFVRESGELDLTPNTQTITKAMLEKGIKRNGRKQWIENENAVIYPQIYFCPNSLSMIWGHMSSKSYAVHHFDGSWLDASQRRNSRLPWRIKHYIVGKLRNIIGTDTLVRIQNGD